MGLDRDNFLFIMGWMKTELKLKGAELQTFALIYGFSQDGKSRFRGSYRYIAEIIDSSKKTAQNAVESLLKKGLIAKYSGKDINGVSYCEYTNNTKHGYKNKD